MKIEEGTNISLIQLRALGELDNNVAQLSRLKTMQEEIGWLLVALATEDAKVVKGLIASRLIERAQIYYPNMFPSTSNRRKS